LSEFRLGWKYSRYDLFRFRLYSSNYIHRRGMHTYQHTSFALLHRYGIFYGWHKTTLASIFKL